MKYEIWQVSEEGFVPCNQKWNEIETDNLERDMNSFAEWLGETAVYSMEDNTVADDYGNKFEFRRVGVVMKEIKIYLDLEKIEEETGIKLNVEGEYSDNFLQWIQFLAWYLAKHNKNYTKEQEQKTTELHDILKNCYSEWEMKH